MADQADAPSTTETPAAVEAVVETPAVEAPDFTGQTDEQVAEAAEQAAAEAAEFLDSDDALTEERELVLDAALARRDAAKAEMSKRSRLRNKQAALRAQHELEKKDRELDGMRAELEGVRAELSAKETPAVPRVADIIKPAPAAPVQAAPRAFKLVVPTDSHNLVNDRPQGSEFGSFAEVGQAMEKRLASYGAGGGGSRSVSHGLAVITRDYGRDLTVRGEDSDDSVIANARRESNLAGGSVIKAWQSKVEKTGSLTAAAGWCAPSETLYDLCEMETTAGLIELPEVVASRGGIRYTSDVAYPDLFAATNFTGLTEAQVIAGGAGAQKNCAPIPCPTFVDTRLNVSATCVTGSFMQLRGYPELVARYVRGAMVVHEHKQNGAIIAAMATQAGAVTAITTPTTDAATSAVLKAVELAANDIRYRYQLARSASLEVILPEWIIPVLRDDFTRRPFPGDPAITDAQIMNWFAVRNVRPQFVRDWQDGWFPGAGTAATLPGGDGTAPFATEVVPIATAVQFMIYPAGSVVLARQDVITLRNVYDSTNLGQNLYTELFMEDGWAPIYPCQGLRLYSALTTRSGATGLAQEWPVAAA